jgi:hypothetical protein
MSATVITALITALGTVLVAVATYWSTKKREREAELRKEKLEHYKDFVASLSGAISGEDTPDGQRAFARASNRLMLVAPQSVIEALQRFQQEIKASNTAKSAERHDELMSALFFQIRRDLGVSPADDERTFRVGLWASGVKPNAP